jgi:hypothetical protein
MKGSARKSLHTWRASVAIPFAFFVGGGIAFFSSLFWEGHHLGYFDGGLILPALYFAFWAGMSCAAVILLIKAIVLCIRDLRGELR